MYLSLQDCWSISPRRRSESRNCSQSKHSRHPKLGQKTHRAHPWLRHITQNSTACETRHKEKLEPNISSAIRLTNADEVFVRDGPVMSWRRCTVDLRWVFPSFGYSLQNLVLISTQLPNVYTEGGESIKASLFEPDRERKSPWEEKTRQHAESHHRPAHLELLQARRLAKKLRHSCSATKPRGVAKLTPTRAKSWHARLPP